MTAYSEKDFELMASALGLPIEGVVHHSSALEDAAWWYRHWEANPLPDPPHKIASRLRTIAKAANKLLAELGVPGVAQAPDGPDPRILHFLLYADNANDVAIVRATERIGRVTKILEDGVAAAKQIRARAAEAQEGVAKLVPLLGIKGHKGDQAFELWLASVMVIYRKMTGKQPSMNVGAVGRKNEGKAGGKFLEFVRAAGSPIGIKLSPDALRSRARGVLKNSPSRK